MSFFSAQIEKSSPRRFVVVGLHLDAQGGQQFFGALGFRVKGQKLFHDRVDTTSITSFEELAKAIKDPVVLQVEGPVVVHRDRRDALVGAPQNGELHEAFFIGEEFSVVTKRTFYDAVLARCAKAGVVLLEVKLGCSGLTEFTSMAPCPLVGHYQWGALPRYESSAEQTISLDGAQLSSRMLSLFLRGVAWQSRPKTSPMHQEWFWRRQQNRVLWIGLPVVLAVLVVNFMVYQPLYSRVQEKESVTHSTAFMGWEQQKQAQEQRQALLRLNVQNQLGKKSWYADELFQVMPKGVSLTSLEVFPVKGRIKGGQEVRFSREKIIVQGHVSMGSDLEQWIAAIKAMNWTGECQLKQYDAQEKGAAFMLVISVLSDE